ncbi:hypothetical protein HDU97_008663 [Phlyctochytrium planicorne]|nr:hypothetical protein HDU97_008663 [Phlyctochytrium planicorne]
MGGGSNRDDMPVWHKVVGISLALGSAFLIGASFVLKKRGLLDSNKTDNKKPGQGHGYLKNGLWWLGLVLMLVGELCNVAAYAFSPAILVTPLGAVSVVISAIMSDIFLKEKLNFSAKIGCAQCILGAILLVVNSPASNTTTTIQSFWDLALQPIFVSYFIVNGLGLLYLVFYAAPRWGERWPLVYISICSIIGSMVVVSMQGFGSAVVYSFSAGAPNQFKEWSMYPLLVFVVLCGVMQINYLNKALNIFSTAIVTPIYYVFFTTATLVCSAVLLRDFKFDNALNGVSALVGFLVIVGGVALLFAYSLQLAREEPGLQSRTSTIRRSTLNPDHGNFDDGAMVGGSTGLTAVSEKNHHSLHPGFSGSYRGSHMTLVPPTSPGGDVYDMSTMESSHRDQSNQKVRSTQQHLDGGSQPPTRSSFEEDVATRPISLLQPSLSVNSGKFRERPISSTSLTIDAPPGGFAYGITRRESQREGSGPPSSIINLYTPNIMPPSIIVDDTQAQFPETHQTTLNSTPSQTRKVPKRKGSETSAAMLIESAAPFGISDDTSELSP